MASDGGGGGYAPSTFNTITVAVSRAPEAGAAVADLAEQINLSETCFLLLFVPAALDRDQIELAMGQAFAGVPVFGCTSAGQITPDGYESDALLAIAFPKAHFRCASMLIPRLNPLPIRQIAEDLRRLSDRFPRTGQWRRLGLTIADGLSKQEDMLVSTIVSSLEDLPFFGGSAGDALEFKETFVLHSGRFHRDAAIVILIETDMEFTGLGFDHFLPSDKQMVVTKAIPEERLVLELNGAPAAQEYARLLGRDMDELTPLVFAENPVLVRNNAMYHVRGIQQAHTDGGLAFLSAIEDGLLLTLGTGQEILHRLEKGLTLQDDRGNFPEFILGFDCFLRKLEIAQKSLTEPASDILRRYNVIGFNTYGEQHCGVHVNQTFVGVAFFQPAWNSIL